MPESSSKLRWYHPTPDKLLLGLLVAEVFLFLADRFGWFGLTPGSGWNVLATVSLVMAVLVIGLFWFDVSLTFGCRFQFSVRSLCVLTVSVAIVSSWFAVRMQQARRQREAVEAIGKVDGATSYDYELDGDPFLEATSPGPQWLRNLVGVDFLSDLEYVNFRQASDAGLVHLEGLARLQALHLSGTQVGDAGLVHLKGLTSLETLHLKNTQVSDAGLVHLKRLTNLKKLRLGGTRVTNKGVAKLQRALPNCYIRY